MELPFFTTTASSSNTTSKGEALRWLDIAQKLLAGRDLVGSKTFATRAKEADPTLLYADQIIAVTDTMLAGEKRINNQHDWYSVLQLAGSQTREMEAISGQYRKLTFHLNPQKNRLPYADQAFNLVLNAWSVLSNSSSKTVYDNEIMAHLSVVSPSSGFNNPIFSGVTREQVNYQPFEINFQVMPQQQQQQQQGVVREHASQLLPTHGMNRERVTQHFPPQNATQEQVTLPFPQLHLSREQIQQPPPQPQPQPQMHLSREQVQQPLPQPQPQSQLHLSREQVQQASPQPQPQSQLHWSREQVQQPSPQPQLPPQLHPQPQPQPHVQLQPQLHPDPQPQHPRKESWISGNVTEAFSGSSSAHNHNVNASDLGGNANNVSENAEGVEVMEENGRKEPLKDPNMNFWTACPYCYYMYEYPKDYADCVLKCQNKKCRKAFHGVVIPAPSLAIEGKDAYFCSWGVMPMGISMTTLDRRRGIGGNWTPFSPMFTCPKAGNIKNTSIKNLFGVQNANNDVQGSRGGNMSGRNDTASLRVVVDDDDIFVEYSGSGEESDSDFQIDVGKKGGKGRKRKVTATPSRNVRKAHVGNVKNVSEQSSDSVTDGFVLEEGAGFPVATVTKPIKKGTVDSSKKGVSESSKKGVSSNFRRQSARVAKNFGSLDLNIEFSNEAEEPRRRVSQYNGPGRGEEDIIIEGGGFFEGLDEFLSSLPLAMPE